MSIRMIGRELYRLHREVERLEREIRAAPADVRDAVQERLRRLKAERDRMRKVLDGTKEPPPFRQPH